MTAQRVSGTRLAQPITDAAGNPRGDLDYREVPISIMCIYLGIGRTAFWNRWLAGHYPREGGRLIGTRTVFRPRIIMGIDHPVTMR